MASVGDERGSRPRQGEELVLEIDSLAQGGRGVARANGYVVFVTGALPGDRVRARLTKAKRAFAEASAVKVVEPAPDRIPDRCLHDGEPCPGAPWQGLPYDQQLEEKARQVEEAWADWTSSTSSPSSPPSNSGATATSSSTRSASATANWCWAFTAGAAGRR
jgi:tRNA/tmRNA/rRNA uracil-C5-methylase (TrmA/RlmC/RlmD family)